MGRGCCSTVERARRRRHVKPPPVKETGYESSRTSSERARQSLCSCKSLPARDWPPDLEQEASEYVGHENAAGEGNTMCFAACHKRKRSSDALTVCNRVARRKIYALSESTTLDTQRKLHRIATDDRRSLSSDQCRHTQYPYPPTQ